MDDIFVHDAYFRMSGSALTAIIAVDVVLIGTIAFFYLRRRKR
jgi:LPXTG-motif cell wall-anchored protein